MKRILTLTAAAVAVAVAAIAAGTGWTLDFARPSSSAAATTSSVEQLVDAGLARIEEDGRAVVDAGAVLELLDGIPRGDGSARADYRREEFGQRWADVDRNGCDTRNDVLRRDLVDVELKPGTHGCVVLSGTLHDVYTGATIAFVRGDGTSQLVQIDHLWPLALSWDHGAAEWTLEQRQAFANDPLNLQAVDGGANASKAARGPGGWLPENPDAWCEYIARFTLVADTYGLTVADEDRSSATAVLAGCEVG